MKRSYCGFALVSSIRVYRENVFAGPIRGELLGAEVTMRVYPGMAHTINDDEIAEVRRMVEAALDTGPGRARTSAEARRHDEARGRERARDGRSAGRS